MPARNGDDGAEAAVLTVFTAMLQAICERRDADTAWRLFVDEDNVAMWGSGRTEIAHGYDEIGALLRRIASSPSAPFTLRWDHRHVTVTGAAAWVNAVGEWVEEADGCVVSGPYRLTAVLVRRDGGWRWHTFSASEPAG
jgi:hypothetical protein